MAIPRMFDSNTPFVMVTGGSELSFPGKDENNVMSSVCDEGTECSVAAMTTHLSRVMQLGTAKHLTTQEEEEEDTCVSIVAQAESEDFQEFSPSNTQCPYSRAQLLKTHRSLNQDTALISDTEEEDRLPHFFLQRKHRRKQPRGRSPEYGEHPPIIRGLWVQEIDWLKSMDREMTSCSSVEIIPPPPQFTDSVARPCSHGDDHDCSCCLYEDVSCECVEGLEDVYQSDDREDVSPNSCDLSSDFDKISLDWDSGSIYTHDSDTDSSCDLHTSPDNNSVDENGSVSNSKSNCHLMQVSGFTSNSSSSSDDCTKGLVQGIVGISEPPSNFNTADLGKDGGEISDIDVDLSILKGRVTHMPKLSVSPSVRDLIKQKLNDWRTSEPDNEGVIFHHQLQPHSDRYREGEEWSVLHHIQNGSYGDVFCVRDKTTGFKCAAKRISLHQFSSEEVGLWSALDSPRVVQLFGAVRDGLNILLFMDLKPACLAGLLREMKSLPEDLSLHYLHQTLGALEHLHHRSVLHLDVKVDNVLLSADCRDTFLCDFGLSQSLDETGRSTRVFRGAAFAGTETHMAPEVARGDRLCSKADVWSSCCMLLHMLNGCHPWVRYYSHPLCFQIVTEPPPLWEVPSNCNNFTAKVFRAGLQKEPERRASPKELRRKTTKALRAVGGLSPWSVKKACEKLYRGKINPEDAPITPITKPPTKPSSKPQNKPQIKPSTMHWVSPWRTTAVEEDANCLQDDFSSDQDFDVDSDSPWDSEPKSLLDDFATESGKDCWDIDLSDSNEDEVDIYMGEDEGNSPEKWLKTEREYEGDWEEEEGEDEMEDGEDWDEPESTEYLRALRGLFPLLQKGQRHTEENSWGSKPELEYIRDDVAIGTMMQTPSPEPRDDPPSCFSCSDMEASDKESEHSSDDLSSGVFSSCNSHTEGNTVWSQPANQTAPYCFEGVDIWIENVQGECLRIRERRQVKVGHVAIGISDQISGQKAFTLETLDRKLLAFDEEIRESCLWLRSVPAPDRCPRWTWRVRDGKLELRE